MEANDTESNSKPISDKMMASMTRRKRINTRTRMQIAKEAESRFMMKVRKQSEQQAERDMMIAQRGNKKH